MIGNVGEHRRPSFEGRDVVQGVVDTDDDVKFFTEGEGSYVTPDQSRSGTSASGVGEHLVGQVDSGERETRSESREDGPGATAQLQHRLVIRLVLLDEVEDLRDATLWLTVHCIVKSGEGIVLGH